MHAAEANFYLAPRTVSDQFATTELGERQSPSSNYFPIAANGESRQIPQTLLKCLLIALHIWVYRSGSSKGFCEPSQCTLDIRLIR